MEKRVKKNLKRGHHDERGGVREEQCCGSGLISRANLPRNALEVKIGSHI